MKNINTDVLIVGAGPTGLMMANMLQKYDIPYQIIDKRNQPSLYSKALVVHSRTMEMMDLLGISNFFLKESFLNNEVQFYFENESLATIDMSNIRNQTNYPFMSLLPQSETEKLLEKQLLDQYVKRSTELVNIEQHKEYVKATVRKDNEKQHIFARYVIGCDGAHSATRHLLDMPFEGESEQIQVMLGDVKLDEPSLQTKLSLIFTEKGLLLFAPFQNAYTRVIAVDFEKQGKDFPEEVKMEDIQETVTKLYPGSITLSDPFWLSGFTNSHRQVPSYRKHRVFLAGDAAHIHNPLGGQGMNLGIQDAVNLSWKLAYTLKYHLPSQLLDSYSKERMPVAKDVIRKTDRLFQVISAQNKYAIKLRNKALQLIVKRPSLQKKIISNLSELNVDYTETPFAKSIQGKQESQLGAGGLVPDVTFHTLNKEETNLYNQIRSGECLLLVYTKERNVPRVEEKVSEIILDIEEKWGAFLKPLIIIENDVQGTLTDRTNIFLDIKGQVRGRLGLQHGDAVVVRPDTYALIRASTDTWYKITEAFMSYFG